MGRNPSFDYANLFVCAHTDLPPIVIGEETIDGIYASWGHLPPGWSSAELPVVDAVPFEADTDLANAAAVKGNIMLLCIRNPQSRLVPFWEKVKRASEAGAAAVIIVNTDDVLMRMTDSGSDFTSDIPVLMIKSSDLPRLQKYRSALLRKKRGGF